MKTIGSLSLAAALLAGTMAMAQTPPPNDSGSGKRRLLLTTAKPHLRMIS
jgi:hypothetical protein